MLKFGGEWTIFVAEAYAYMRLKTAIFLLPFLFILNTNMFTAEIYLSSLKVYVNARNIREERTLAEELEKFSPRFKQAMTRQSGEIVSYKDVGSLPRKPGSNIVREPVTSNLDALAICFFYKLDYILYGELYHEADEDLYRTYLNLYSAEEGEVVKKIDFSRTTTSEDVFLEGLATALNKEIMILFAGYKGEEEDERSTGTVTEGGREEKDERDEQRTETARQDGREAETERESRTGSGEEETGPNENAFGIYLSLGYFIQYLAEWKGAVVPAAAMEEGVKWSILAADGESFDFYIRPSLLITYSFAVQDPSNTYHRYIHYHTLSGKGTLDFLFEFGDTFGFFLGGGLLYRIDIIDFRTRAGTFYTDIASTLGCAANLGLEFFVGKRKNIGMGVTNSLEFAFFSEMALEHKILAHFLFKI